MLKACDPTSAIALEQPQLLVRPTESCGRKFRPPPKRARRDATSKRDRICSAKIPSPLMRLPNLVSLSFSPPRKCRMRPRIFSFDLGNVRRANARRAALSPKANAPWYSRQIAHRLHRRFQNSGNLMIVQTGNNRSRHHADRNIRGA